MSPRILKQFYDSIPPRLQHTLATFPLPTGPEPVLRRLHPYVMGRVFRETSRRIRETQYWSRQQLETFQLQELHRLVQHAYANSVYYRKTLDEANVRPGDITSFAAFRRIPMISKETLRDFGNTMMATNGDIRRLVSQHTGGTTSPPVFFYEPRGAWEFSAAFFWRWWEWCGYHPGDRTLVITGTFSRRPPLYDPLNNVLRLYVQDFSYDQIEAVLPRIRRFSPKVIRGYPSLIFLLADYVCRKGLHGIFPRLIGIFPGSEQLFLYQADRIREAFGVHVLNHYGQGERVALIQQCPKSELLHVIPEYSYVELIGGDGQPLSADGELGIIVGTSFANQAMPLIRYRMEDWATLSGQEGCLHCGRQFKSLKRIEGRSGDFVITPSGKRFSATVLEFAIRYMRHFKELQLIQPDIYHLDVLIVPDAGYKDTDGWGFAREIEKRIGDPRLEITVNLVKQIERPRNQKQRFVRSNVSSRFMQIDGA